MRDVIEDLATFLGTQVSTDGIRETSFEEQAVGLIDEVIEPWLHRLTMKKIEEITFVAGNSFGEGNRVLEIGMHCRRKPAFPRGITFKTRVFTGPDLRGYTENRYGSSESTTTYRELYWALTQKRRWLRIEIFYEIENVSSKMKNVSLVVKEYSLEQLVADNWSHSILAGLFKEVERAISQKVKDVQELVELLNCLKIVDELIRHKVGCY